MPSRALSRGGSPLCYPACKRIALTDLARVHLRKDNSLGALDRPARRGDGILTRAERLAKDVEPLVR